MTCPFLEEVKVRYCRAFPVKKLIPSTSLSPESACVSEFFQCPTFQDAVTITKNGKKECIWAIRGVVSYRVCTKNFDCKTCEFDQMILDRAEQLKTEDLDDIAGFESYPSGLRIAAK